MIKPILQTQILKIISQSYALDFQEVEHLYFTINSFDALFDIVNLSQVQNINLNSAFELWKEHHIHKEIIK